MNNHDEALIRHLAGPGSGREVVVRRGAPLIIGRDDTCGLQLDGATVSRQHARILLHPDRLHIELASTRNPLWVNGSRVDESNLRLWDLVVVGPHVLRVERLGASAAGGNVGAARIEADASLLACLLEVQRLLATDEDRMVERALEVLLAALPATRLALFEPDANGNLAQGPTAVRGLGDPLMSAAFARRVLDVGAGVLLDEGSPTAPDWTSTMREQSVRSILGVPVRDGDRVVGVLLCDNRDQPGLLDGTHLRVLDALARSLTHVVQRDQLRRLAAERLRSEAEVAAARRIQEFLAIGGTVGDIPGEWSVTYRPALDLAGDVHLAGGDDATAVWLVADVSGKGLPAALVSAMLKAAGGRRLREGCTPAGLLAGLHQDLAAVMPPTMFFTACALRLDADGNYAACGVGHPSVLVVRRDGTVERLPAAPGMLGLRLLDIQPSTMREWTGRLGPGDRIVLLTDGATEAMDPDDAMLGEDGVRDILAAAAGKPPSDMADALERAIADHRRGLPASDDLTVVIGGL